MVYRKNNGITALFGIGALFITPRLSHALPVDVYLKMRRAEHCDRTIQYADAVANFQMYQGKVLELRGSVNGSIRKSDALAFLLTLPDNKSVFLDAPTGDEQMVSEARNQSVRVLCRVGAPRPGSNVLQLIALGIAYEGDVIIREKEAEAAEAAINARKQAQVASSNVSQNNRFASRGFDYTQSRGYSNPAATTFISAQAMRVLSQEAQSIYPYYRAFIQKCNKKLKEKELDDITCSVLYFSQQHRVDPRLVCSMIIAESDFDPKCTSNKGAMGLGQVMPDEAQQYKLSNPYDPVQNVGASVGLLKSKLLMYSEGNQDSLTVRQVTLALAAYNAGPGAVKKYGGVPPYRETQGYVKKILSIYKQLCGG